MTDTDKGGTDRYGLPECPKCGGDYTRGYDIGDYCIDCKTIFMPDPDGWSIEAEGER